MRSLALPHPLLLVCARAESLYDVLGVLSTATPADIRNAYRTLAMKLHPDKAMPRGSQGAGIAFAKTTERFIKVSEAYETLSDAARRAGYDRERTAGHLKVVVFPVWAPARHDRTVNVQRRAGQQSGCWTREGSPLQTSRHGAGATLEVAR